MAIPRGNTPLAYFSQWETTLVFCTAEQVCIALQHDILLSTICCQSTGRGCRMDSISHPDFSLAPNSLGNQRLNFTLSYALKLIFRVTNPIRVLAEWEGALQSVTTCSLNVLQKLSQLYISLRAHYTPVKLHEMGILLDPLCGKCKIVPSDLIHLLWRCPKLHRYWKGVLATLNSVF